MRSLLMMPTVNNHISTNVNGTKLIPTNRRHFMYSWHSWNHYSKFIWNTEVLQQCYVCLAFNSNFKILDHILFWLKFCKFQFWPSKSNSKPSNVFNCKWSHLQHCEWDETRISKLKLNSLIVFRYHQNDSTISKVLILSCIKFIRFEHFCDHVHVIIVNARSIVNAKIGVNNWNMSTRR